MFTSYDSDADALYIRLLDNDHVVRSVEIDSGTLVDFNEHGSVVGIELIHPSRHWPIEEIERCGLSGETANMLRDLMEAEDHWLRFGRPLYSSTA